MPKDLSETLSLVTKSFSLWMQKDDYGRIASQTTKQVIIQKIREAEKQRFLRNMANKKEKLSAEPCNELSEEIFSLIWAVQQECFHTKTRFRVNDTLRVKELFVSLQSRRISTRYFLRLSRSHPKFLEKLFELEAPEINGGTVTIKAVAREAGSRSKVAVASSDSHIDPVGSMVGQRGVRVTTVMKRTWW